MSNQPDVKKAREYLKSDCGAFPANVLGALENLISATESYYKMATVTESDRDYLGSAIDNAANMTVGDQMYQNAHNKITRFLNFG